MGFMLKNFKVKTPKLLRSVKYSLSVVNGLFLLTGVLLLAAGATILILNLGYDELIPQRFFMIPKFVIATGVIILLSSVLGFYAAISEHFLFILGYVVLLLLVLIFEVSIVIAAYALRNDAARIISAPMLESLRFYSSRLEIARLWDDMQMEFQCCGVGGRFDYISNQIPVSCCHMDYGTISPFVCGTSNAYETGCAEALGEWLSYNAYVIAVCALVAMCFQVVFVAMSGWLAWRSKYEDIVELES